jgi:hypothetical protein
MKNNLDVTRSKIFTTKLQSITAQSSEEFQFKTTTGIPFEMRYLTGYAESEADVRLEITIDNNGGTAIFDGPVGFKEVVGDAKQPFIFPTDPQGLGPILPPSTILTVKIYNDNVAAKNVRINLIGFDIVNPDEYEARVNQQKNTAVINTQALAENIGGMIKGLLKIK